MMQPEFTEEKFRQMFEPLYNENKGQQEKIRQLESWIEERKKPTPRLEP